uniref:Uncharacterized protein n=1 Tax=Leersia perrieri TaxID=77586 RepID=A0A0D9WRG3_9ORYZ
MAEVSWLTALGFVFTNFNSGSAEVSWLTALGFAFLTFNSAMAMYRSDGDVSFVATSYIDLLLPFVCLCLLDKSPSGGSPAKGNFKAVVWVLMTLLTIVFSYKITPIMPLQLVLAVAGLTALVGFYAFSFLPGSPAAERETRPAVMNLLGFAILAFNSGMAIHRSLCTLTMVACIPN